MDREAYEEDIRQLIGECEQLSVEGAPGALRALRKLGQIAEDREDAGLLGFVHFYTANYYYDKGRIDRFHSELKDAVHCLLRSGDHDLLARAYNFFATHAQGSDAFDIAYSYYTNALSFIDEKKDSVAAGVVLSNLGSLHYEIGDYRAARRCFRRGQRLIKKNESDPFFWRNLLVTYLNDGLNSIAMEDLAGARASFRRADAIWVTLDDGQKHEAQCAYGFFGVRLALAEKDRKTAQKKMREMVSFLREEPFPVAFAEDIRDFCNAMMRQRQRKVVGEIIDAVGERIRKSGYTSAMRQLAEVKVDYYDALHDEKKLSESLLEQHRLLLSQSEEQRRIYKYSLELVKLIGELQEEETRVREENEGLQIQVRTDTLTQIPNRYAMDQELDDVITRARSSGRVLGVEIMDVDDFKAYNDTLGHRVGDLCLEKIAEILREHCRNRPIFCARYGGDEFVLVYEEMTAAEIRREARAIGEAIARCRIVVGDRALRRRVTVSQGICIDRPGDGTGRWDYLSEADMALYEVKDVRGKNRISVRKLPGDDR